MAKNCILNEKYKLGAIYGGKVLTSSRDQIMLLAKLGYTTYTAKGMYLYSTQTCFAESYPS